MTTKHNDPKPMGGNQSSSKRDIYSNTILLQETRQPQINNLTLHIKEQEKEEQTKPKVSRRKEIIKIRAEINEIETKKTIAKINKIKSWFFCYQTKLINHYPESSRKKGEDTNQQN